MTLIVLMVCVTLLIAQDRAQKHERMNSSELSVLSGLMGRIAALEAARAESYDPAAFEELKSKVEALRIAQGFKRG